MNETISFCEEYVTPSVACYQFTSEGVLCGSPVNPGYGGGEDMEEGDEL